MRSKAAVPAVSAPVSAAGDVHAVGARREGPGRRVEARDLPSLCGFIQASFKCDILKTMSDIVRYTFDF